MLMPARYVQDTGKAGCNTVTQTIDRLDTAKDYKVFSPGVDGFRISGDGTNTSGVNGAGLSVESAGGVSYLNVSGTTPLIGCLTDLVIDYTNTDYTIPISISSLTGTFSASIIMRNDTGVWVELASVAIPSAGTYNLNFNPSTPNVRLTLNNTQGTGTFARNAKLGLGTATYYPRYTTVTVSVCDVPGDAYRFGFNGKEKDNEIAGIGNFQDYGFREYDTRIARFNTVDPLSKKFPYFAPYAFAGNSPIKFVDLDGKEMYAVGTGADDYVNMISSLTGLSISKDATGLLSYATTTVSNKGGPFSPAMSQQVPVIKVSNSFQSTNLRNEVIKTIQGGPNVSPVTIKASATQLPGVPFDDYKTNDLDMADFNAVKSYPEFQAAMVGHIINERNNPVNQSNILSNNRKYNIAHAAAVKFEGDIMREYDPNATNRNDKTRSTFFGKQIDATHLAGYLNDYKTQKYLDIIPNPGSSTQAPNDPSNIVDMTQVK